MKPLTQLVPPLFVALHLAAGCQVPAVERSLDPWAPEVRDGVIYEVPPEVGPLFVGARTAIRPGRYLRRAGASDAILVAEGLWGVTIDLRGVELAGLAEGEPPDRAEGCGLLLRDCKDVTVRGGSFSGYRVAVRLESCRDVDLEGVRVERHFAQRLASDGSAPAPADLLQVDCERGEEWLERYGAAFALLDCSRVEVRDCRARAGQNGLVAVRCEGCRVIDGDFSFLSGWGLAMQACSAFVVAHNRFEYCARGFARDRYAEGFNSAGVLLYDRCERNTFAYNAMTRCGTGALVLAPTPERGCGGNYWYGNDLSFAVTDSVELRAAADERFVANTMRGSLAGGLRASGTAGLVVLRNAIEGVWGPALALEDCRDGLVAGNGLCDSDCGVRLSWRGAADDMDEATLSASPSRDHWVVDNELRGNIQDLVLEATRDVVIAGNRCDRKEPVVHLDRLSAADAGELVPYELWRRTAGPDGGLPSGRVWRSSLRPRPARGHPALADPALSAPPTVPGTPRAPGAQRAGLSDLVLESHAPWDFESGAPRPETGEAGGLLAGCEWSASWFAWDAGCDPRGDVELWRARGFAPIERGRVRRWADPWGGSERTRESVGSKAFGLIAHSEVALATGAAYRIVALSDDGVRLLVDGAVVLEDWTWHPARRFEVELELAAGRHALTLEYFQIDGPAVLTLALERARID